MTPRRLVVLGTLAGDPYAGMTWMTMQIVAGLHRLFHDVYYFEVTSSWPYDVVRQTKVKDSSYAVSYLARVAASFGLADRWAYRCSFADHVWLGMERARAEAILAGADAVFNIAGATRIRTKEGLRCDRLIYFGTDPVYHEIGFATGDDMARRTVEEHDEFVTYGENIGCAECPVPPLPRLRARTRQPVLLDAWQSGPPSRTQFTTVGNWKQAGRDVSFGDQIYRWSKHHEFLKFIDLPRRVRQPFELALNLAEPATIRHGRGAVVAALGVEPDVRSLLEANGWGLADSRRFTTDPWTYRDYVVASRGEFTVARDLNVRLRSGWFSERSACYLAAGRPVVTQDTGFGTTIPTGEGLFAFNTMDEILSAFEAINSDYERHSRAASELAAEYFRAETVLAKLLNDLGL